MYASPQPTSFLQWPGDVHPALHSQDHWSFGFTYIQAIINVLTRQI
jgi:hypothetical protein